MNACEFVIEVFEADVAAPPQELNTFTVLPTQGPQGGRAAGAGDTERQAANSAGQPQPKRHHRPQLYPGFGIGPGGHGVDSDMGAGRVTSVGRSRVFLAVPYVEKDEAKLHGARWDAERRQWWIERRHLSNNPGIRKWMVDDVALPYGETVHPGPRTAAGRARLEDLMRPVTTSARTFDLPACACSTPPWEHCEHTRP